MMELRLSQGAKPGKGGILRGKKVTEEVSRIRGIAIGEDSISRNRHPKIDSAKDLLDMIARIRNVCGEPVGFKAVIGACGWLDELYELVRQRRFEYAPDFITVASGDGGSGAAPISLMDSVGLPIKESLALVVNILNRHGLKDHIRIIASDKLVTSAETALALCAGADFVNSARGLMFSLVCIQTLQCNLNARQTGITAHDKICNGALS